MRKPRVLNGPFYFTRQLPPGMVAPVIRAELPEMFRAAEFQRADINAEERTVPVVFATETPVSRWFGRERLVCAPNAVNLDRLNTMGPFLSEHDRERQIGVIVKNSSVIGADRKARATLRFSKNSPLAEQEWKDVQDEIRGLFSVGYVVHRLILREESDTDGDLYDAVEWEALEISLVSVPADVNCNIEGRGAGVNFPVSVSAETETAANTIRKMNRNLSSRFYFARFMNPPDTGGNGGGSGGSGNGAGDGNGGGGNPTATPPPGGEGARGAGSGGGGGTDTAERDRVRELGAVGARFGCMERALELINGGGAVGDLYKHISENGLRAIAAPGNGGGSGNPGGGNRPLLTGASGAGGGEQRTQAPQTLGQMLVNAVTTGGTGFRSLFNDEMKGRSDRKAQFDLMPTAGPFAVRTTLATDTISGNFVSTERLPGIQLIQTERLTIADLCGAGTTTSGKILYQKEAAYVNAAAAVAEGGLKPEATFTFTEAEAPVRKIAVLATINDEMISDYPYVQSYVDGRLRFMVEEKEEGQLLYGDGNSPNIQGFMNATDLQTHAKGSVADDTIADAMHRAITKARVLGRSEPDGAVMHPNDWQTVALAKDANGQYLAGGPFYAPYGNGGYTPQNRIWGLPVVITTAMTEGTALLGAFKTQSQIFRRAGITVETTNSNKDDFEHNRIAIRVEERLALCIYRGAAFVKVTGLNA